MTALAVLGWMLAVFCALGWRGARIEAEQRRKTASLLAYRWSDLLARHAKLMVRQSYTEGIGGEEHDVLWEHSADA